MTVQRRGQQVADEAFRNLVVGLTMGPADWMRALGMAVGEVLQAIADDVDAGTLPEGVSSYSELHDYVDANEYMLASPTCAKVWGAAATADEALPFLNAVTRAVDAGLGSQAGAVATAEVPPDLLADMIPIRSDLRLYRERRGSGFRINRGALDDWPADVGNVYLEDGEWVVLLDDGDRRDEADIRRVLGFGEE